MYQLTSLELDFICMVLNDSLYVLDDIVKDLVRDSDDAEDLRDCRKYRSDLEDILEILQKN
tara:strand:+ start:310 stop:492 length:183 start_codon:yes stop_codon:yes gene_type:complete